MSTLSDLWAEEVRKNPQYANNPVPFQTPMQKPVITNPVNVPPPVVNKPIFNQPVAPVQEPTPQMPKEYINPATGELWTPQEYANNVAKTLPISKPKIGDVPQYTADQFSQRPQTEEQLVSTATGLRNVQGDIATGTTDPYDITRGGAVVYNPAEKEAIRKAYAGIYDPAITTALYKLDEKQKADAAAAKKEQDRLDKIFNTNEAIRQWKATTGSKSSSEDKTFSQDALNRGSANSGLGIDGFSKLDKDLQNFYINPPTELNPETNKMVPMYETFANLVRGANTGKISSKAAADEIEASTLPESVKHYFIDQLDTLPIAEKEGYFRNLWGAIWNK